MPDASSYVDQALPSQCKRPESAAIQASFAELPQMLESSPTTGALTTDHAPASTVEYGHPHASCAGFFPLDEPGPLPSPELELVTDPPHAMNAPTAMKTEAKRR